MDVEEWCSPMILWFDEITSADVERVGGKGANLGECARAGLPVPPGFCITTEAYREATGNLPEPLTDDTARKQVLDAPMPESVEAKIRDAYAQLGEPMVAVRSSATAEDLVDASFAGQQDTYLGVLGIDELLDAVRRCWASLWTRRAVDYRRQQGVPDDGLALAVVVQQMIPADTAGVLFTQDPVTGDDSAMLASSSYGLGESVVGALVTPDTFTLSREPKQVLTREIGSKKTRIDQAPGGGTVTIDVPEVDRARQSVSDVQLLRLLDLGERVEAHYQAGQDIEWAFAGSELFLLQARPITTSTSRPEGHAPARGRVGRELRDNAIEHFPAPFPLDLYAVHQVWAVVLDQLRTAGLQTVKATSFIKGDEDGIIRIDANRPRIRLTALARLPRMIAKWNRHNPAKWPKEEAAYRRVLADMSQQSHDLAKADDETALNMIHDSVIQVVSVTTDRLMNYLLPSRLINSNIASTLIKVAGRDRTVKPQDPYANVPFKTAEITAAIAGLAATARDSGLADSISSAAPGTVGQVLAAADRGPEFQTQVADFLAKHGARTAKPYLPFSNRSWREEPETLYALLAAALRGTELQQNESGDPAQEIEQRLPRFLRNRWRTNASRLRARHVAREGTLYLIEEFFCVARAGMDEIARRLVDRGQLDAEEDLRFLYFEEVQNAAHNNQLSLQQTVSRRRRKRGMAEAIWWDRGETVDGEDALRGVPASAGRATGTARVIRSPEGFHRLQVGEILVCPYTDPTWTPLFALAAAIVADTGGPLSHAAIVAREYGIPAVLGVPGATSLPDGTTVLVDGSNGTVTITEEASQ